MPSAFAFPEADPLADSALVAINMQLLPFALGAIADLQKREYWQSDQDWYRACESISEFLECSMGACVGDLLAQNDRLYRLLDAALNGTAYSASGDPVVVVPAIPDVPPTLAELPGLLARIDHVELMLDGLPGVLDPGWFGYGGQKATIADIVRSLRIGSEAASTETIDSLQEILGAGADVGAMGGMLVDAFGTAVETVAEGGIFTMLALGIVAQLAAAGALSAQLNLHMLQLQRITRALDGGGFIAPGDNILQVLRGDEEGSSTRNIIDSIVAALALITTDDPAVLAKLEEIRVLLA